MSWKYTFRVVIVICLLSLFIPIKIKPPNGIGKDIFDKFIKKYNKGYELKSDEYYKRYKFFMNNTLIAETMNKNRPHENSAIYGVTKFSDLAKEEFIFKYLNKYKRLTRKSLKNKSWSRKSSNNNDNFLEYSSFDNANAIRQHANLNNISLEVDWRTKGIISDVVDQSDCGVSWAISTVHTIEAINNKYQKFTNLSIQQIIDCANKRNYGCSGGDVCNLLKWLINDHITIFSEKQYSLNKMCHINNKKGVCVTDYTCQNLIDSEITILKWLANKGPLTVAVNALPWQYYFGEIIHDHCDGNLNYLNHAVQIIGYNLTSEIPYYIIKNSWGNDYGIDGYVYLAIGNNTCGLANEVSMIEIEISETYDKIS